MRSPWPILPLAIASFVAPAACGPSSLPSLPETVLVVDTDLPVPAIAARLRIDLYAEDGTWFDARDDAHPDARDWPVSFGVYSDDESRERIVWVRARAYPEGQTRDYLGERRSEWPARFVVPAGDGQPRLVSAGVDRTPPTEPAPLTAVDRLVRVRLRPGVRAHARVVLRGACAGTMAKLDALAAGAGESCVDQEKTRVAVDDLPDAPDALTAPSEAGTWLAGGCGAPAQGDRICVPGGGTLIGAKDDVPVGASYSTTARAPLPVRVFGVRPFWMDRTELTVAQVRAALAAGFSGAPPRANDGPLARPAALDDVHGCTYSSAPMDREDDPVTCVSWSWARAFCQAKGGDLPTEVQWEHAASLAGRASKTRFPWGNEGLPCDAVVTSRAVPGGTSPCPGVGPDAVTAHPADATPLGILGLGGAVSEWVRDDYDEYTAGCWADASIVDPTCAGAGGVRQIRGSAWMTPLYWASTRVGGFGVGTDFVGVRCVYEAAP